MSPLLRFAQFSAVFSVAALLGSPVLAPAARAADAPVYKLVIKDHKFQPEVIEVPANTKFVIEVHNQDDTPEEFDSNALHREKIVRGGGTGTVNLGPLKPGTYPFIGEFHEATAKGKVVAK